MKAHDKIYTQKQQKEIKKNTVKKKSIKNN